MKTAMAVAAPVVVFGLLYVLLVQPERVAAVEVRNQVDAVRGELNRRRALVKSSVVVPGASALDEFDARTADGDRAREVTDALTAALNSPGVGGVSNLSIATGASVDAPPDSTVGLFSRKGVHTPLTVTFDARYEQIGRFLWNLRVQSAIFDLQSIELTPQAGSRPGLVHAKMSLLVFHRPGAPAPARALQPQVVDAGPPPAWTRDPFSRGEIRTAATPKRVMPPVVQAGPDPVVTSILFSEGRRVARADGRIVGPGDRLGTGVVQSIEPEAVVIVEPDGRTRRFEIVRPIIGNVTR